MNKKLSNTLLIIAAAALSIASIVFLCLSIFTEPKNNTYLAIALFSVVLANLFNVIRMQLNKHLK